VSRLADRPARSTRTKGVAYPLPIGSAVSPVWRRRAPPFYIYDSTGKLSASRTYTNAFDKPVVEVTPIASKGRFQTVGCSPRVMMQPLSPDW
jgi:hypothetical protein